LTGHDYSDGGDGQQRQHRQRLEGHHPVVHLAGHRHSSFPDERQSRFFPEKMTSSFRIDF
jgi:hypothetical protein